MKNAHLTQSEKVIAVIFGLVFTVGMVAVIAIALNVIPWMLWNHAVAPMFGWRLLTFWQVFVFTWAISILGRLFFGRSK